MPARTASPSTPSGISTATTLCILWALVAEDREPQALHAGEHRRAVEPVPLDRLLEALVEEHAGALARAVEHGGGLGVVVEPARTPVVDEHGEVEVVAGDARAARRVAVLADAGLDVATSLDRAPRRAATS